MRRQATEDVQENAALLNVITPVGLEFQKNQLSVGENMGKIYGIIRYPQTVEPEWLSKITNIPGTIASIGFNPVDNAELMPYLKVSCSRGGWQTGQKTRCHVKGLRRQRKMGRKSSCRLTGRGRRLA